MSRSYRTPPAKWLHNEKPVDMITIDTRTELSGTGHRYIGDSSTAALHIDSARLEDDGIWRCIIEHEHGELLSGRTVKLFILGMLKILIFYFIHFYFISFQFNDQFVCC